MGGAVVQSSPSGTAQYERDGLLEMLPNQPVRFGYDTEAAMRKKKMHELAPFLAIHADRYATDNGLDGLHPIHYDLMVKYGVRMDAFKRATNAEPQRTASRPIRAKG